MKFQKAIPYEIRIFPTVNEGFVVIVGCCNLAYTDKNKLIADMAEFLNNPKKLERQYGMQQGEDRLQPERSSMAEALLSNDSEVEQSAE
jgi:hypothetical protein